MAQPVKASAQKFTITNVAMSTTAAALTLPARCNYLCLSNPDAAITIKISFDNVTFFSIAAGKSLSLDGDQIGVYQSVYAKSASATPTLEVLAGWEA